MRVFQDWLDHARTPDVWDAAADAAGAFMEFVAFDGLLEALGFYSVRLAIK